MNQQLFITFWLELTELVSNMRGLPSIKLELHPYNQEWMVEVSFSSNDRIWGMGSTEDAALYECLIRLKEYRDGPSYRKIVAGDSGDESV